MLFSAPATRSSLRQLVRSLTPSDGLWSEDCLQEAWIHLWLQEERRCPGQSNGYYLRGCRFHQMSRSCERAKGFGPELECTKALADAVPAVGLFKWRALCAFWNEKETQ